MALLYPSAILSTILLAITISNFFLLRKTTKTNASFRPAIAVLIPLRNEELNLPDLIASAKGQRGVENVTFHLIDDSSSDDTFQVAQPLIADDSRFKLHKAPPLPGGWLGKPATLQYGLTRSQSELVVIIDADVRLMPNALQAALSLMQVNGLDFISAYPRQIAKTWSEILIQPLLQWSWMSTVPLRIAEKSRNASLCIANGQFFAVRRSALAAVGEFAVVKAAVIDDIFLARALVRGGFHGTVIDGSDLASCRMYSSWRELRDGYGKSLHLAFGGVVGTLIAISLLILTCLIPLVALLFGSILGFYCFIAVLISRFLSALSSRAKSWGSLAHPLSILLLLFLIFYSWRHRKHAEWKGRKV